MEKKITILCGMKDSSIAKEYMYAVVGELVHRGYKAEVVNRDTCVVHTENTQTCFHYDITKQPLGGVHADAIFGLEPYKEQLAKYLKPGHPYNVGVGLVDYICQVESTPKKSDKQEVYEWHPETLCPKSIYISTGRGGGKSEFCRRYMEQLAEKEPGTLWPKREFVEYCKTDCDITYELYKKLATNEKQPLPEIVDVIFNNPAVIVKWADGTKTVVRTQDGEPYDPEKGLAMAMCKKMLGNNRDYYHVFKHWLKRA